MIAKNGEEKSKIALDIIKTYVYDSADKIGKSSKDALNSFVEGDELTMMLMGIRRFTKVESFNPKDARQRIALHVIDKGYYSF
jgi:hypothetical protein